MTMASRSSSGASRQWLLAVLMLAAVAAGPKAAVRCDVDPLDCGEDDDSDLGGAPVTSATVCDAGDRRALLALKAGISADPKRALASWDPSSSDCCSWNGVACDGGSGRVIGLDLSQSSLSGRVVAGGVAALSALRSLKLYSNSLSGSIPGSLGNLSSLAKLCLASNRFSGSIPASLGRLSAVRLFDLGLNSLSGAIPDALVAGLASAQLFDVSYNSLSGSLPRSIGNMSSLQHLRIYRNDIGGRIPGSLSRLSNMYNADLGFNRLSGAIPASFNRAAGGLASLAFLFLENNRITRAPADLSSLKFLQRVVLDNNPIASLADVAGLLTAPRLAQLQLANCGIAGSDLGAWLRRRGFPRPDFTLLSDEVTPSISLEGNRLSGSIPADIGALLPGYIQGIALGSNRFSGGIPASIANLTSLRSLGLEKNKLRGSIPAGLAQLTNLAAFNVSYNRLSGEIPQVKPFTTFDVSSYRGNPGLCGTPLPACR